MKKRHFFVIAGGVIDDDNACGLLDAEPEAAIVAADAGMEFLYRTGRKPDVVIGDFDSVRPEVLAWFKGQEGVVWKELNPVKDDTDTESAVRLALSMGAAGITLLGATGGRLDHLLGNIELLGIGLMAGVPMQLCDAQNRVRMVKSGISIRKAEQYGSYVSLIPYSDAVEHLTLHGFYYPLSDYRLTGFCSLGVSNEIVDEEAFITFDGGILLVIESRDAAKSGT